VTTEAAIGALDHAVNVISLAPEPCARAAGDEKSQLPHAVRNRATQRLRQFLELFHGTQLDEEQELVVAPASA
jgi:hypothetical protein